MNEIFKCCGIEYSFKDIAKIFDLSFFKIFSEGVRVEILKYLALHGESDVGSIADNFKQDRSVISRHLKAMEQSGILKSEKIDRRMLYSVDGFSVLNKLELCSDVIRNMVYKCCPEVREKKTC